MKKIAVLMGGISSERDISISSGKAISLGLNQSGYNVTEIILDSNKISYDLKKFDLVFLALHGIFGEDGQVQMLLDKIGVPYTGSSEKSCKISFDKILTRKYLFNKNVNIPKGSVIYNESIPKISFPLIIKPATEGSSVGCHLVKNKSDWLKAYKSTLSISKKILVEEYIPGREITVGIVGSTALPIIEVIPDDDWYDFHSKYNSKNTKYIVPAKLDHTTAKTLQSIALNVFNILGASGFARIDFRLNNNNIPYVLELNSIPGFTEKSLLPKAAEAAGISFPELCKIIVEQKLG